MTTRRVYGYVGNGESATEARSRWHGGLYIPVLNPGELEGFQEQNQASAIGANEPATEPGEQYELFLRNLLDFDDWRQAQRPDGGEPA